MEDDSVFSWGDIAFDVVNDDGDDDNDASIAGIVDGTADAVGIGSDLSTCPEAVKVKSYKRSSRRKKHTSRQSRKFKGR